MRNSFEFLNIAKEELEGTSDRAAVIVGGAIIDEILRDILESFLLESASNSNNNIFSGNGPLATFSSKISMAYSLGLIGKWEKDRIDVIRKIRNDFAHGFDTASFSNQATINRCISLKVPFEMIMPRDFVISKASGELKPPKIEEADITDPRSVFQECVFVLISCLAARACLAMKDRRKEAKDFSAAHESIEVQLETFTSLQERYKELSGSSFLPDEDQEKNELLVKIYKIFIDQTKALHGIK